MRQLVNWPRAGRRFRRVADGRAFSALDYLTRLRMRNELARLLSEMPRTAVLVTHDIEEAAQLADRIVVLTQRPARIVMSSLFSTPRPREPTNPEVVDACANSG